MFTIASEILCTTYIYTLQIRVFAVWVRIWFCLSPLNSCFCLDFVNELDEADKIAYIFLAPIKCVSICDSEKF